MESLEAKGETNVKFFFLWSMALTTYSPTSSSSTAPSSRSYSACPCPALFSLPVDEVNLLCPGCPLAASHSKLTSGLPSYRQCSV